MPYHRLAALVMVANLGLLGHGLSENWWAEGGRAGAAMSDIAMANFLIAVLVRQPLVVNLLFRLATGAPRHWPLSVRWALAKVYHLGGLHIGGAVSGTAWLIADAAVRSAGPAPYPSGAGAAGYAAPALLLVLVLMVATALPPARRRMHDLFERVHRLGGWSVLALLWVQEISTKAPFVRAGSPRLWCLVVLTASVALPWLVLRRRPVAVSTPSGHVALTVLPGSPGFAGATLPISRSPLGEWHSFATLPGRQKGEFRLVVSQAGDWTGDFVDDPPSHVWTKGIPTAGAAHVQRLFTKVAYVATGSGIGPILPHLLADRNRSHLLWVARSPHTTYGEDFVAEVTGACPSAVVWDSSARGKPDMVQMAYDAWRTSGAEAVVCISNRRLTRQIVHALESRGVPAFGAIWDS